MGIFFSETYDSLRQLLTNQLRDLYDAEHQILQTLPKLSEKASSTALKQAFDDHKVETEEQIEMLEKVFSLIGEEAKRETCEACKGLIKEGDELLKAKGAPEVIDAGLICAAQRVEHYEISGYGSAKALAKQLGYTDAADILDDILDQEIGADEALTAVAEDSVNAKAASIQAA